MHALLFYVLHKSGTYCFIEIWSSGNHTFEALYVTEFVFHIDNEQTIILLL
jgi:hypothetical protein